MLNKYFCPKFSLLKKTEAMKFEISVTKGSKKCGKMEAYDFSQKTFNSGLVKIRVRRQMVKMHKIFSTVEEHRLLCYIIA